VTKRLTTHLGSAKKKTFSPANIEFNDEEAKNKGESGEG
jgi:hypothetical protein